MKNSVTLPMTHSGRRTKSNGLNKLYQNVLAEFKSMQTGYSTIAIIGQSCIGSVAAMMLLMSGVDYMVNLVLLFLVTIFCMAFNSAVLAQLKAKTTFDILLLSVAFSLAVIVSHLF